MKCWLKVAGGFMWRGGRGKGGAGAGGARPHSMSCFQTSHFTSATWRRRRRQLGCTTHTQTTSCQSSLSDWYRLYTWYKYLPAPVAWLWHCAGDVRRNEVCRETFSFVIRSTFSFNFSSVVVCIFHFYCCVFLVFVLPSGVIKNEWRMINKSQLDWQQCV